MREIKFRAWDNRVKKWRNVAMWMVSDLNVTTVECDIGIDVVQYTGLKDKNGKEIYEGDIVKELSGWFGYGSGIRVVEYFEATFYPFDGSNFSFDCDECEVIGNIYENPELVK